MALLLKMLFARKGKR